MKLKLLALPLALLVPLAFSSCGDGEAEAAGETMDEAADDAKDAIEDAGDEIEDATDGK